MGPYPAPVVLNGELHARMYPDGASGSRSATDVDFVLSARHMIQLLRPGARIIVDLHDFTLPAGEAGDDPCSSSAGTGTDHPALLLRACQAATWSR